MTMRPVVVALAALVLASCTEASASRIDARTFSIESPAMSMESDGPLRRKAASLCPNGFYKVSSESHKGGADRATYENDEASTTIWRIRCID